MCTDYSHHILRLFGILGIGEHSFKYVLDLSRILRQSWGGGGGGGGQTVQSGPSFVRLWYIPGRRGVTLVPFPS